jgi:hypothetical protein
MKGVVLTSTGQPLVTPSPAELARLLVEGSPGVGLDFTKIFDEEREEEDVGVEGEKAEIGINEEGGEEEEEEEPLPPSPSDRKNKSARGIPDRPQAPIPMPIPTRAAPARPPSRAKPNNTNKNNKNNKIKRRTSMLVPSPDPAFAPARRQSLFAQPSATTSVGHLPPSPKYDLADEENLPSPFLKRHGVGGSKKDEKEGTGAGMRKRGSLGNLGGRGTMRSGIGASTAPGTTGGRASIASARKAGEEARRALART